MALFNGINKKITSTTQNIVRGTKDFTDTARFQAMIDDEKAQIEGLLSQIGKLYVETNGFDPETPLGKLCIAARAAKERIAQYEQEIRRIKGLKRCPACGTDAPLNSIFCGECGTKIETHPETTEEMAKKQCCTGCGAQLEGDVAFCTACGQKICKDSM